ncbi:MAG: TetR family transcriptional regulator [Proteobacteria bacterium]|nr:TetR family transcriptional regulator [Pseudomonadota bacterium]
MVRRTKLEAEATRTRILDTAELLFEREGVARTSLHEIAQAAGVTRGAIYWHFKDKADLFNAMMKRVTLPLEEGVHRSDDPDLADPLVYMRERFMDALRKTAGDPQTRRVFEIATHKVEYVGELTAVRDRHLAVRNECLAHVERGMRRARRRGLATRRLPARSAALGLHALIDGLIQNWMLDPQAFDLLKVGRQVLDAYLAGLEPTAPAR